VRADGEIRWVREQGTIVGNLDNNSNHEIGILQDITEQKSIEQSLREARDTLEALVDDRTQELAHTINQLKTEMAERDKVSSQLEMQNAELERYTYTVSHDLKTPLVTIKGFVALLGKDIAANDAVRIARDFEKINNAADTMERLLSDLLELSRIGRVMGDPESCNLNEIAARAIDMVRSESHARGVKITTDILPQVMGDATRLLEVFQNLLENAIKFMGEQPEPDVNIGTVDRDGEVCCYVRDNGIGIDGNYHQHIFGLFERLNAAADGTGVGLALVKRIIEVHGGKIWVESDGLNQGCSFYFTLPG